VLAGGASGVGSLECLDHEEVPCVLGGFCLGWDTNGKRNGVALITWWGLVTQSAS
jgi:hypothetical protein